MDCPFYEQLQYAGDARIQMMISLYMTGDSRLMRNGIALLNSSRTAEGATYSRAPSYLQQYIPPFSLVVDRHGPRLLDVCGRSGSL